MSARTLIEQEPNYSHVAARLLMDIMRREALGFLDMDTDVATQEEMGERLRRLLPAYIKRAAELELLDKRLAQYDLDRLGAALKPERDLQFTYLGLQTLYDRYFIHDAGRHPLRVAAGILHARRHGPGDQRDRPRRRAPSSSTTCCRASTS